MRGLTVAALLLCVAHLTVACAPPGRDAPTLRRTALGHMPAPAGSVLVSETYFPPEQTIDGSHSSWYERIFATNTPQAFTDSVVTYARTAHYNIPDRFRTENIVNTGPGWIVSAPVTGEGVSVSLQYLDLDVRDWKSYGRIIDVSVWRYAAVMQIFDSPAK